ncbi:MAG: S-layer homology domain-containing protein [Candidatus Gracilibacteria bacterium]|nr:S-layer homology domain-containing protein [Candidatus Gracilibacteria bacterium]
MKLFKLFISFFLIFSSIFYIFENISINKSYKYNTNNIEKNITYEIKNKEEASLDGIKSSTGVYSFSDKVESKDNFDTVYFKIPKKGNLETYGYKAKLRIFVEGKSYDLEVDQDGDERMLLDDYIHFSPVFLSKSTKNFSYTLEFNDKSLLVSKLDITTLDTKSFSYNLAFTPKKTEADDINIIKRSEWGAVEDYRYADSKYWKSYYDKLNASSGAELTPTQKAQAEKTQKINDYLKNNFPEDYEAIEKIDTENGHPLVRPIEKTRYVKSIVIHHTDTRDVSKPSDEILRGIYYYHSLQNGRGDIGYQYIVGQDGKIYEGKAGGDYVLGSHALRNNRSTVAISVIGNYQNNYLSDEQQASINKLIGYLAKKYGIDLDKERTYHKSCLKDVCATPLLNFTGASLIGHRDAGYTTCPGDNIYNLLASFKESNLYLSSGNKLVLNEASMKIYEENKLKRAASQSVSENNTGAISETNTNNSNSFDKTNIIKIKLSYPENQNTISLKTGDKTYDLEFKDGKLYNDGVLVNDKIKIGTLTGVTEITSWSRIPAWDTSKKLNDNKFRGIITLYSKDNKLVVVNELYINDYMKGIGEISNDALEQKAKTILVSARSYARWYISSNNRKFPGEYYDGSDDPEIFQKYLGYGIEQRNANIVKYVEDTLDEVITYNGNLVKPWYFNQSNGKTLSYYDYCLKNNPGSTNFCKDGQEKNYPYLIGVDDPSGSGKTTLGHGVGLSGDGANYFAKLGRDYKKIILYYYTGVKVSKLESDTYATVVDIKKDDIITSTGTNVIVSTGTINISTGVLINTGKIFSDIDSSNKYYTAIAYFKNAGVLNGFSDGSFKPDNSVTRSEALKIILTAFKYYPISNKTSVFKDVQTSSWENTYIQKAVLVGLLDTKNTNFFPKREVNKVEALKMVILLKKIDITKYQSKNYTIKDISKTDWYYKYAVYALENKLFSLDKSYFYGSKALTRGELVELMYKLK